MKNEPLVKKIIKQLMKKYIVIIVLISSFQSVMAQQHFTLSGYIRDAKNGEDLIGATITVKELPGKGAAANTYGFYSLTLPAGTYQITVTFVGYVPQKQTVELNKSVKIDFILGESVNEVGEVVVTATRKDENIRGTQMGEQKLDTREIKNIPVFFGERDILKTIQLLPGIKPVGEGSSGFTVRGGASDQNLVLLDEATVYNASHLMGFFSVFNSDAIKEVTVYKGNESAEYGGRLSSVVDVKMNEGNDKKIGVSGGIGLISSRLTVEGPIVKNKGSFIVSARRTYADVITQGLYNLHVIKDTMVNKAKLYFYDFNVKANYKINDKNRIFLSGYFGQDKLGFGNTFGINWGNATGTLRLNHLFSDRMFSNTSLIFSNFDYNINAGNSMSIISRIQDYGLKQDYQFYSNDVSTINFGFSSIYHRIIPGIITLNGDNTKTLDNKNGLENALYISHKYTFSDRFNTEYGVRLCSFTLLGPGTFYSYDADGTIIDSSSYKKMQSVKTYINIEPRASLNYKLNEVSSLKASYARNTQNLHLLSNSTSINPRDLWIPSSNNVKPEIADQVAVGYFRNFDDNKFEFSSEVYYKNMQNQIGYKNGAVLNNNNNVESQILFGKGRAYGLELFVKKKYGKFNGWISYTLSRTEGKFVGVNNDNYFPFKQDRTHDISIVGIYDLNTKWTVSGTWVYYTGNAVTFPAGKYMVDGQTRYYITAPNSNRMPPYHRLDLGATYIRKKTDKFESSWTFSIYNAYMHDNAYSINFQTDPKDPTKTQAVQTTLFKMVPSVTYNFKF